MQSKIISVLLFAILAFLIFSTWKIVLRMEESGRNLSAAAEELKNLNIKKTDLLDEISFLKTDQGVEEEIRQKFMMAKPGEEVIVMVDDKSDDTSYENSETSLWSKFLNVLGIKR